MVKGPKVPEELRAKKKKSNWDQSGADAAVALSYHCQAAVLQNVTDFYILCFRANLERS